MSNLARLMNIHDGHHMTVQIYYDFLGDDEGGHTTDDGFWFTRLVCHDCHSVVLDSKTMDVLRFDPVDILHHKHLFLKPEYPSDNVEIPF